MKPYDGTPRPPHISMWYPRGKSSFLLSIHHGMYMCAPPAPSQLWGTWSTILGMNPARSVPVVSVRYFPTVPLAFANPSGKRDDLEFNRMRADSQALAANTTTRARTCVSAPVLLSMYDTPVASPRSSTVTSRAIALVMILRRPVCCAGNNRTLGEVKLELFMQPRLHCPQ